jgi:hypothetical protein
MKPAFDSVLDELRHNRDVQKWKYAFTYTINKAIPNGGKEPVTLNILDDADFVVQKITISAYGPTNSNGVRQVNAATNFPMAGTLTGFADRGLQLKVTDKGSGRDLTNGYVNLELFGSPGYGVQLHMPFPYNTTFYARSQLVFDFNNRDSATIEGGTLYHFASIALTGYKYAMGGSFVGRPGK